jgi:hypothetical protein
LKYFTKICLLVVASLTFCVAVASPEAPTWEEVTTKLNQSSIREETILMLSQCEDDDMVKLVKTYQSLKDKDLKYKAFKDVLHLAQACALSEKYKTDFSAVDKIAKIKSRTEFKSSKDNANSNWIQKAMDRFSKLFERKNEKREDTSFPDVPAWVGGFLKFLFYFAVAVGVAFLIVLVAKLSGNFKKGAKVAGRQRGGVLEDGEELLSEDEYLKLADHLIAEGKFREACRALYIASLLRIDALKVARLEPTETNWEHLMRIEKSRNPLPSTIDFRATTKQFDFAWYGYRAKTVESVEIFRNTYLQLKNIAQVTQ